MISRKIKLGFVIFAGIASVFLALAPENASASFFIGGETEGRFTYRCCGATPTFFGSVVRVRFSETDQTGRLQRVFPGLMWPSSGPFIGCIAPRMVFLGIGINRRIGRIRVVLPIFGICMPKQR